MTLRSRQVRRPSRRARLARIFEGDERQQLVVTLVFIAMIVIVVLILVGAVGVAWYNAHLRPLATIGSTSIDPQLMTSDLEFEQWRITRDTNRITQAEINGDIDADTATAELSALSQSASDLTTTGLDNLVDLIYQSQLAADQGISVGDADVAARLTTEVSSPEQRHVLAIFVAPQAADATAGPTLTERKAALDKAQQALDALQSGQSWADVAAQYSSDPSAQNGGDYGTVIQDAVSDPDWGDALFKLPLGGTTEIILGSDGTYRIGRVTEITPGTEVPSGQNGSRDDLFKTVSQQDVDRLLRYQIAAERLSDKITSDALSQTPEQARLAVIYVDGLPSGDPASADGEIDYSEIVIAPGGDTTTAVNLAADDPAWDQAKADADAAMATLKAIPDASTMITTFTQMATTQSNSDTAQDGGAVGYVTRSVPPTAVSDALFGSPHQANDLIGPVRADDGYYILLYHDKRPAPEDRVKAIQDALAQPGADFSTVASQLDEGPEKADGGEIGWFTQDQLSQYSTDLATTVFGLSVGQISDPVEVGSGQYIIKLEEKTVRALDPDQKTSLRPYAFSDWYTPKKDAALADGTIVISDSTTSLGN